MILLIDHLDSFTHNLSQGLAVAAHHYPGVGGVEVVRSNAITVKEINDLSPVGIVLSPGPGRADNPRDLGITAELLNNLPNIPILGVCLGMQAMAVAAGATLQLAPTVMHGKTSTVNKMVDDSWLLANVSQRFEVMRYHSWCVAGVPKGYGVTAVEPESGVVMALEHGTHPWSGVQFHPESIGTPEGQQILINFVAQCNEWGNERRHQHPVCNNNDTN
ncbi:MAG: aminodeoxychorismate/anthranilate synthase component II [Vampirovibrionales bacterium]|nr:aminodeoxychorismate/anthranilate synthase component II [Vampirovibrionales bacterium]